MGTRRREAPFRRPTIDLQESPEYRSNSSDKNVGSSSRRTSLTRAHGPGLGQKAHRFGLFSEYEDYIDVPFEVWNIETNEQLMVAFQDTDDDTTFDLRAFDGSNLQREYIVPTSLAYDPDTPIASIADSATTPDIFEVEKGLYFIQVNSEKGSEVFKVVRK